MDYIFPSFSLVLGILLSNETSILFVLKFLLATVIFQKKNFLVVSLVVVEDF